MCWAGNTPECEPKPRCAKPAQVGSARLINAKMYRRAWTQVSRASLELSQIRMCSASHTQPAKCYGFLRHASSALPVAQKVVLRLERQVAHCLCLFLYCSCATLRYLLFLLSYLLPLCYCNASFLGTVAYASLCYSCLLAQYQHK